MVAIAKGSLRQGTEFQLILTTLHKTLLAKRWRAETMLLNVVVWYEGSEFGVLQGEWAVSATSKVYSVDCQQCCECLPFNIVISQHGEGSTSTSESTVVSREWRANLDARRCLHRLPSLCYVFCLVHFLVVDSKINNRLWQQQFYLLTYFSKFVFLLFDSLDINWKCFRQVKWLQIWVIFCADLISCAFSHFFVFILFSSF